MEPLSGALFETPLGRGHLARADISSQNAFSNWKNSTQLHGQQPELRHFLLRKRLVEKWIDLLGVNPAAAAGLSQHGRRPLLQPRLLRRERLLN